MNSFHPITILIFFAAMITPLMLANNPYLTAVSLVGAVIVLVTVRKDRRGLVREFFGYAAIFLIMAAINPLFVHRGRTPLLFINGRAVTLEAILYGLNSALMLVTAVIWCRSFSTLMTSDRLFCITGKLSPKISAMLTTAVRFIPDMLAQGRKIAAYSKSSGRYNDASLIGRIRRVMGNFSALVTWSIENAVHTADSMKARGFELGGRTAYSKYRFTVIDTILTLLSIFSAATALITAEKISLQFYPSMNVEFETLPLIAASVTTAASYLFPSVFAIAISTKRRRICSLRTTKNLRLESGK